MRKGLTHLCSQPAGDVHLEAQTTNSKVYHEPPPDLFSGVQLSQFQLCPPQLSRTHTHESDDGTHLVTLVSRHNERIGDGGRPCRLAHVVCSVKQTKARWLKCEKQQSMKAAEKKGKEEGGRRTPMDGSCTLPGSHGTCVSNKAQHSTAQHTCVPLLKPITQS